MTPRPRNGAFGGTDPNGTWNPYVFDSGDSGTIAGGWTLDITAGTTAVRMRGFSAARTASGTLLRWRTASELDVLGFHVWRNGRRITRTLIAAPGRATGYRFLDRGARASVSYVYRLQVVDTDGTRRWYGRVAVPAAR